MEPAEGVEGQLEDVQRTLRLLVGLLLPCLFLLGLLSCLFLLRGRPARGKLRARGLGWDPWASPHLLQVVPHAAGSGASGRHLRAPGTGLAGLSGRPLPSSSSSSSSSCSSSSSRGHPPRPKLGVCSRAQAKGQPRGNGATKQMASSSASSASGLQEKRELLAPPNSPATSPETRGIIPHSRLSGYLTSTRNKVWSGGRSVPAAHSHSAPLEYGSSILWEEDGRDPLTSANFTASQGPGLDSDFGVSAGVSVRIVSSDSEESPQTPLLHRQRLGQLEWDYYDPRYQKTAPLHHPPPPVSSKQYWL